MPLHPLIGHEAPRRALRRAHAAGSLPDALLLRGPKGVGKRRLALWLAQLTLCESATDEGPCDDCRSCRLERAALCRIRAGAWPGSRSCARRPRWPLPSPIHRAVRSPSPAPGLHRAPGRRAPTGRAPRESHWARHRPRAPRWSRWQARTWSRRQSARPTPSCPGLRANAASPWRGVAPFARRADG